MRIQSRERIGRCEVCGLVDHHLVGGECPACRRGAARAAEVLDDADLERLARRYNEYRALLPAWLTFEQYVNNHNRFDEAIDHLAAGGGCRMVGNVMVVPNRTRAVAV